MDSVRGPSRPGAPAADPNAPAGVKTPAQPAPKASTPQAPPEASLLDKVRAYAYADVRMLGMLAALPALPARLLAPRTMTGVNTPSRTGRVDGTPSITTPPMLPPIPPPGPTAVLAGGAGRINPLAAEGPAGVVAVAAQGAAAVAAPYLVRAGTNVATAFMEGVTDVNALADAARSPRASDEEPPRLSDSEITALNDRVNSEIKAGNASPNMRPEMKTKDAWTGHFVGNSQMIKQSVESAKARVAKATTPEAMQIAQDRLARAIETSKNSVVIPEGYGLEISDDLVAKLVRLN